MSVRKDVPSAQIPLPNTSVTLIADRLGPKGDAKTDRSATHAVTVVRADLLGALRMLTKFFKPKQQAEAFLTFTDGSLHIELLGNGVSLPANGRWDGEVRATGLFMVALAKALPTDDPLPIFVKEGRLHVAGQSVLCTVQEAAVERIELAINASLTDILRVRLSCSDAEIERSGLTRLVRKAEEQRDALIARAYEQLGKLEVRRDDLRQLVDESIRRSTP